VDKIVNLRDSLRSLSASVYTDLSFPPYHGPVLDMLYPVTAAEVTRVVSSSPVSIFRKYTWKLLQRSVVL